MRWGRICCAIAQSGEVKYYDSKNRMGPAISGTRIGKSVAVPYGVDPVESMDANGGWIASAIDLVRFAVALEYPQRSNLLKPESLRTMVARPAGLAGRHPNGRPNETYYGCGWNVRPINPSRGRYTKWHTGLLGGTSSLLVSRSDRISWAVLFNSDADAAGKEFASTIDPLLHGPADRIKRWPEFNLFEKFSG